MLKPFTQGAPSKNTLLLYVQHTFQLINFRFSYSARVKISNNEIHTLWESGQFDEKNNSLRSRFWRGDMVALSGIWQKMHFIPPHGDRGACADAAICCPKKCLKKSVKIEHSLKVETKKFQREKEKLEKSLQTIFLCEIARH